MKGGRTIGNPIFIFVFSKFMHIEIVRMSYKSIIFLKFNANVFGRVKKMNREKLKTYNKNRSIVQICYITNDNEQKIKLFT